MMKYKRTVKCCYCIINSCAPLNELLLWVSILLSKGRKWISFSLGLSTIQTLMNGMPIMLLGGHINALGRLLLKPS